MASEFSPDLLNRYVARAISDFTICDAPELAATQGESNSWLAHHFLSSVFNGEFTSPFRHYVFNQIFRAQAALDDYQNARNMTAEFLSKGTPRNPAIRAYFRAVSRWESCFLNLQFFIDLMKRMRRTGFNTEPVFEEKDGTAEQRAYDIATAIKHWGTYIEQGRHHDGDTIPLWLTNAGFATHANALSYRELADLISRATKVAEELRDPATFVKSRSG